MAAIESDPALGQLRRVDVDRVDVEVRGIPALQASYKQVIYC